MLIVVHNLPVPFDRRVWQECLALRRVGFEVSVICPRGPEDTAYTEFQGVRIRRYATPRQGSGPASFAWEFAWSMFRTAELVLRTAAVDGFDAVQVCNPPDTYVPLVAPCRLLGLPVVFDQHDLSPEIFQARSGRSSGVLLRLLLLFERWSYAWATHVVTTNESYRQVALTRGGRRPDQVTVVRNGPDTTRMRPTGPRPELRAGRRFLCCYLGIMGPQDGVDLLLEAFAVLVHRDGRRDCQLALLGYGESLPALRELAVKLAVDDLVTFTGRVDDAAIESWLSTADIGVCPDPFSPLNDVSTMIKVVEYLAYGVPVIAFDLTETRVSASDAAVYVTKNDIAGMAEAIRALLDDPDRRGRLAAAGRRRAVEVLDWRVQADRYTALYRDLTDKSASRRRRVFVRAGQRVLRRLRPSGCQRSAPSVADPGAVL